MKNYIYLAGTLYEWYEVYMYVKQYEGTEKMIMFVNMSIMCKVLFDILTC